VTAPETAVPEAAELEWVFAYGSNMNVDDLRTWLAERGLGSDSLKSVVRATLRDYRLVWNYYSTGRRGGAANIEMSPGHALPGVVLQVDSATRAAIDQKEGHPRYYSRGTTTFNLHTDDGTAISAWVYIARPERCRMTPEWPTRAYRDLLVQAAVTHGLPEEHVAALKQVQVRGE
jgi:gamma-glutamylcyclotransferase (GGCT)/AIG2-like uncharacterized protein YtfP